MDPHHPHQPPSVPRRPGAGRRLWEGWKRVGRKLGTFQARVLLTVFYFVILAPFALLLRLTSDPLALRKGSGGGWRPRAPDDGADPMTRALAQS